MLHILFLVFAVLLGLGACSQQPAKPSGAQPADTIVNPELSDTVINGNPQTPPLTLVKNHKKLNLVRIMDGGACKSQLQGAKGTFLLYADPIDIQRVKNQRGAQIFSEFEARIQTLSTEALEHAIAETNLNEDPFALGEDVTQEKLAKQLIDNFRHSVGKSIDQFERDTTLSIDILAFAPSFIFFQKGCELTTQDDNNSSTQ
jgi:hypothetical protein